MPEPRAHGVNPREKWTFPAEPKLPHTMSIDFGASTAGEAADSSVVLAGPGCPLLCKQRAHIPGQGRAQAWWDRLTTVAFWLHAGVEVGGALVMGPDGLWENRLGPVTGTGAHQLCHDVHQLRPDMRNPKRFAAARPRVRACSHPACSESSGWRARRG